jgi:triosephosphate isomerase
MRQRLIVGNWKMFKTVQESVFYIKELRALMKSVRNVEVMVAPPFLALHAASEAARGTDIGVGAQNVHWEKEGAFTGEVSAAMIQEAGGEFAIIGHSERRGLFGETDLMVNRKLHATLAVGLIPIVCVGETEAQRAAGQALAVLDQELKEGIDGLTAEQLVPLVLAYEPVWAIGTGQNATPEQAQEAHAHLRARLRQWLGADAAERCQILYGGSVKVENIQSLIAQPDVDGALIGGASLDVRTFVDIARQIAHG